ncbi:ATP-binding cassette domain-containing protein [Helicobacter saguini]|uniref:ABC transporter ATP-binding protein n=1 Tax=Helicobacter saguini TaxID=1548018 RepID=A0A347VS85_9HELI|nr:ABC transporter ATP-binding protein [Helicobacter saguini]MWV62612.1 ATP-binding cassette domain-containing protein [Helicobacter saguini]MWV66716.1 ATP-binding cassette domain-containing protein [Helicobacter saguini]MWV69066.1 ATP-binding cassette domain-containing protein [Helicobacter saguini]MWV71380.1 ATP-binding cassette domain-containing protein [Helicobacter saguini]TLD94012.1 ABC transporter ATP-binding protein [Helicobacter saguini]
MKNDLDSINTKLDSIILDSKKKGIARLLELSSQKSFMLVFSGIFSALSAILQFVPYFASYLIACEFILYPLDSIDNAYVLYCGLIAIVSVFASMVCTGVSFTLSHFAAYRILYNIRLRILAHLATLPLGYFTATTKGEIHKNVQENVEKIENFIAHKIPEFLMTLIGALSIFGVFLWANVWLGLVCIAVYIIALRVQFSIYKKGSMKEEIERFYGMQERINARSIEYVDGMSAIKLFNKSAFSFSNLANSINAYKNYTLSFTYKCMPTFAAFNVLTNCFIFFIMPLSAYFILQDTQDLVFVLTILFFVMMSNGLIAPLLKILTLSSEVMQISEGVRRIDNIFKIKPLLESSNPQIPKNYDITFKNVNFVYPLDSKDSNANSTESKTEKFALKNINFTLKQGEFLVILGQSGGGKSTILSLLARFFDIESGEIKIGGVNIKDIKTQDLMNLLSLVFQDSFLFLDTLSENIKAGCKNASEKEVLKAIKDSNCAKIVQKIGLDSIINKDSLSGGETQRVNIARAMLKNAPIFLLDEITANLDTHNENAINKSISTLSKQDKTIIMVTHKLQSVKYADKIALIDKGELIAFGSHSELLQSCQMYKDMWQMQHKAREWSVI